MCAAVNVAPLFAARWLPFSDLPEHVATIAAIVHYRDPAWRIAEHYAIAWGQSQYLLYHLLAAAIAAVVGSAERANLVLLAAAGIAYPYAARSMLRALDRDVRLALFACPLFWNHALVVGLLPFVASVPVVLVALGAAARHAKTPTRARFVGLSLLAVLLFFLHVQALLLFALASSALTFALGAERATKGAALRALPARVSWMAPAALLAIGWGLLSSMALHGGSLREPGQVRFVGPSALARGFPFWAHDVWLSHVDEGLAIAFWVLLATIAVDGLLRRPPRPSVHRTWTLWAPCLCALLLYVALPYQVGGGDMLNLRLAVFFPLFALLTLEPREGRRGAVPLAGAALLTFAWAIDDAREVRAAAREVGDFDRVLAEIPTGARLLTLEFRADSASTLFPPWIHAGAYHRARGGGVSEPSFSVLGHWPLHYREGAAPPAKSVDFWEFHPCLFRNTIDGPYYDYVLVRGALDPFHDAPAGPVWRAIVREKDWILYAKDANAIAPPRGEPDRGPCAPSPRASAE